MMQICWEIGALAPPMSEQAKNHGLFLDNAEFIEKMLFGIVAAHINGVITDCEYNRILKRFFDKIVEPNLSLKDGGEADGE